jgi:CSLREA domain-containing protein
VNSGNDVDDTVCDATHCSLREAIDDANAAAGADVIQFVIGSGTQDVTVTTTLPVITESTTIDGTSQPGFGTTPGFPHEPLIRLRNGATAVHGLELTGGGDTVRGLQIWDFMGSGIHIDADAGDRVVGNYIGTDGTVDEGNFVGVRVESGGTHTIGGTVAADRNVISGNSNVGIFVTGGSATIQGNYVGNRVGGDRQRPRRRAPEHHCGQYHRRHRARRRQPDLRTQ